MRSRQRIFYPSNEIGDLAGVFLEGVYSSRETPRHRHQACPIEAEEDAGNSQVHDIRGREMGEAGGLS